MLISDVTVYNYISFKVRKMLSILIFFSKDKSLLLYLQIEIYS